VDILRDDRVDQLLENLGPAGGMRTRRSGAYLRWRYGFAPLHYRAVALGDDPARGLAIFRVRRRGPATEAACCEVLVPNGDRAARRALERGVLRSTAADYVLRLGGPQFDRGGYVRLPGQGPTLTWREVATPGAGSDMPPLDAWDLQLGDIELM
jgi:hypothetical protein